MPPHYAPEREHASVFQYTGVVKAYQNRPPYPVELYAMLRGLVVDEPRVVLELGCGLGEIARELATDVDHVDAVDPSEAMLALGQALPGAGHPNLRWHLSSAEEFDYPATYTLIITAESLGWLDWEVVFPKMRAALSQNGRLVVVVRGHTADWDAGTLDGIVPRYSTSRDFVPYNVLGELEEHGLFAVGGGRLPNPFP